MPPQLGKLEQKIGYKFDNKNLLKRALTHRSWAYEELPDGTDVQIRDLHNETLEFVGDSVLGLVIAEELYKRNPEMSEGDLTLMKHYLVSTETLGKISSNLTLGNYLKVGRGEEKTGGRKKQALLADALEAIIAAIFFDSGYVTARTFINSIFVEEFKNATPKTSIDYKTLLQETLQAAKQSAPKYHIVKTEGLPHQRTYHIEVIWDSGKICGSGSSKKNAEMQAASLALAELKKSKIKNA